MADAPPGVDVADASVTRSRGASVLDSIRHDLAYAARTTLRTPGFAVSALSLGLAVGATTAVYATADWLLNRSPTGVVEPDRLVGLSLTEPGSTDPRRWGFSFPQYEALRDVQDAFTGVAAYAKIEELASVGDWQGEVVHQFVTESYFPLLGVRPELGRLIGPGDEAALAVISHAFWRSRFGGDPDVIGSAMYFGVDPVRVIGVLPPGFEDHSIDWVGPTHVWLPMASAPWRACRAC